MTKPDISREAEISLTDDMEAAIMACRAMAKTERDALSGAFYGDMVVLLERARDELDRMTAERDEARAITDELDRAEVREDADLLLCAHCAGNGEVITDWDAYLSGADAVEDCPHCDGEGKARAALDRERDGA